MLISISRRFIFVHVYKVAGNSVRAALEPYRDRPEHSMTNRLRQRLGLAIRDPYAGLSGHARAREVRAVLPPGIFDSYYKFAFVRDPWDWQVSLYHFALQDPTHHQHALIKNMKGFDEYIEWRCANEVRLQKEFLTDDRGNLLVDFVGRFEQLERDFQHICRVVGIEANLPHRNRSRRRTDHRSYYTDRTRRMIEKHFAEDIALFGYSFEPSEATLTAGCASPRAAQMGL